MSLTLDECDQQRRRGSSNTCVNVEKCCDLIMVYLQRVLESPMSQPMVKFKKPRHMVKSYHFQTKGHCQNALMMAHLIIATAATRHGLNLLHFDSEYVPI